MARIIKIDGEVIAIGTNEGGIKEVRKSDMNFEPAIGDEVEVFETEGRTIVIKNEKKPTDVSTSGININLSNIQNNGQQTYAANNTKAVNKVIYCVLAFFLGGIGVHKFYAGRIGSGIIYLLFCWTFIPAFIALIEFIIAVCKKADPAGNILV